MPQDVWHDVLLSEAQQLEEYAGCRGQGRAWVAPFEFRVEHRRICGSPADLKNISPPLLFFHDPLVQVEVKIGILRSGLAEQFLPIASILLVGPAEPRS